MTPPPATARPRATSAVALRNLDVCRDVVRLLPGALYSQLLTGPRPDSYDCPACGRPGDLDGPRPTSVSLRRRPDRHVRQVVLAHAGCAPSAVGTVVPTNTLAELPDLAYTDVLHPGVLGGRPFLVADTDELRTCDPTDPDGALAAGVFYDHLLAAALRHGLTLQTSLAAEVADAPGWAVHLPADGEGLRLDSPFGTAVFAHRPDPGWLAATSRTGTTTVYTARIGLSRHHPETPNRPGPLRPAATRPADPQYRLLSAVKEHRVAAGRVPVHGPNPPGRTGRAW